VTADAPARKPWVATSRTGFIDRCETREGATKAADAKSAYGTMWVTNEDSGELWERAFNFDGWTWRLKRRATPPLINTVLAR
jgi:hypothetical protein